MTQEEKQEVVTICDHLQRLTFSLALPYGFTEHGALMAANLLNSDRAVDKLFFPAPFHHFLA